MKFKSRSELRLSNCLLINVFYFNIFILEENKFKSSLKIEIIFIRK